MRRLILLGFFQISPKQFASGSEIGLLVDVLVNDEGLLLVLEVLEVFEEVGFADGFEIDVEGGCFLLASSLDINIVLPGFIIVLDFVIDFFHGCWREF